MGTRVRNGVGVGDRGWRWGGIMVGIMVGDGG